VEFPAILSTVIGVRIVKIRRRNTVTHLKKSRSRLASHAKDQAR
jgi:hypothetical protein